MTSRWFAVVRARVRSILRRGRLDAELAKELQAHLEQEEEQNRRSGMAADEAHYAARRRLGGISQIEEECRDTRRVNWTDNLVRDFRYGLRTLGKDRLFTAAAVITLALGISVNTTIFSIVNGWLFQKPAVPDADRVTAIVRANPKRNIDRDWVPARDYLQWRAASRIFEKMTMTNTGETFNLSATDHPLRVEGIRATADYFDVMGVKPLLGRTFRTGEDRAGNDRVVVLSHTLWRNSFASDPNVVGRDLLLNGEKYTIVGVMNPEFQLVAIQADLWVPLVFRPEELISKSTNTGYYLAYARLKPGVSLAQAQAEMKGLTTRLNHDKSAEEREWTASVMTLQEFSIRWENVRKPLAMLMAAVALVLMIACVNVANLLMARSSTRQQELAVRVALGAGRTRVMSQLLIESMLIGLFGGALGLALGFAGTALLRSALFSLPSTHLLASDVAVNRAVLAFTLAISLGTVLLFGLVPAVRASVIEPQNILRQGGRGTDLRRGWGRKLLVAAEVTFAVVLVNSAVLITRAIVDEFRNTHASDPEHVLTADVILNGAHFEASAQRNAFVQEVIAKLRGLPGVADAAATNRLGDTGISEAFEFKNSLGRPVAFPAERFTVTPDYFKVIGLSILQGREFHSTDRQGAAPVVLVNAKFARRFFPGTQAIEHYLRASGNPAWSQIVGIVPDIQNQADAINRKPQIYECYLQNPTDEVILMARVQTNVQQIAVAVRNAVWSVNKEEPVGEIMSFSQRRKSMYGGDVVFSALLSVFGSLALVMAAVGIYGVMAYTIAKQTREIGLRMALGASRGTVLWKSLQQGMLLAATGSALGLVCSLPLPSLFRSMFTGYQLDSPMLFAAVIFTILMVALAATAIPSLRAVRVDPMVALRYD